jgi:hypothetical protein
MFRYGSGWQDVDSFRALYDTIVALKPEAVPDYLLGPGVQAARPLMQPLEMYKRRNSGANPYEVRQEDLWDLYALSRINDHLLLAFQTLDRGYVGPHIGYWLSPLLPTRPLPLPESGHIRPDELMQLLDQASQEKPTAEDVVGCFPQLTTDVYLRFFEALGVERCSESAFSPFYHEVVQVEDASDEIDGVQILREIWPGLRFGEMILGRAGVSVRCSPTLMSKSIAERSTLYWAHKRIRRSVNDLSVGWGHNSQWRTAFRRDYEDERHYYFNVDGSIDLAGTQPQWVAGRPKPAWLSEGQFNGDEQPPIDARRELLVNRCFVRTPEPPPESEPWPWDDTLTVRRDEPFWLP